MRVRHKVRGTKYDVLGEGEIQISGGLYAFGLARLVLEGDKLVVYRGEDGKIWLRFPDEFHDGRFEEVT